MNRKNKERLVVLVFLIVGWLPIFIGFTSYLLCVLTREGWELGNELICEIKDILD